METSVPQGSLMALYFTTCTPLTFHKPITSIADYQLTSGGQQYRGAIPQNNEAKVY